MDDTGCPFCGLDPYEYVDVGVGGRGMPVAVNCCQLGPLLFDYRAPEATRKCAEEARDKLSDMEPGDDKINAAMDLIDAALKERP